MPDQVADEPLGVGVVFVGWIAHARNLGDQDVGVMRRPNE
jgi:hypothetical protein